MRYYVETHFVDAFGVRKTMPRLELVLDTLYEAVGDAAFKVLEQCDTASPNVLHGALSAHVAAGGHHVTVNFDDCVECSLAASETARVIHLHGTFHADRLSTLGARIRTVALGLPVDLAQRLRGILSVANWLVFVGYSGSDYFDITPFFAGLANNQVDLSRLRVTWVQHTAGVSLADGRGSWTRTDPGASILESLKQCGASVEYSKADCRIAVLQLASQWGLAKTAPVNRSPRTRPVRHPVSTTRRTLATAELFTAMGLAKEQLRLVPQLEALAQSGAPGALERERAIFLICDAWRNGGRYRTAGRVAARFHRGSPLLRLRGLHRRAGDAWLEGTYGAAFVAFREAESEARRHMNAAHVHDPLYTREYLELQITRVHWLRQFVQMPVIGTALALPSARRSLGLLIAAINELRTDPHAVEKLVRLHLEVGLDPDAIPSLRAVRMHHTEAGGVYGETDSFLGFVNSERRRLRGELARGRTPAADAVDQHKALAERIGDIPGLLKAILVERAATNRRATQGWKAIWSIEWTWLARVLWGVRWVLRRA